MNWLIVGVGIVCFAIAGAFGLVWLLIIGGYRYTSEWWGE